MTATASPPKRTGGQRIDRAFWDECLRLMRESRANISYTAGKLGSDRKTVRRLWVAGYPSQPWGARPMSQLVQAEAVAAAADRADPPAPGEAPPLDKYEAARRDAIAAKAEEAKLVRATRANVQALQVITASTARGMIALANRVATNLSATGKEAVPLTAAQAMLILTRFAALAGKSTYLAQAVVDLEREVLGDPSQRLPNAVSAAADDMTESEAVEALLVARDLAERMTALGLVVVDGGKTAPPPSPFTSPDHPSEGRSGEVTTPAPSTPTAVEKGEATQPQPPVTPDETTNEEPA